MPSFLPVVGGAEVGAFELGKTLIARGDEVTVLTPRLDRRWPARESMDSVGVVRYDVPAVGGADRVANLVVGSYRELGGILRGVRPDVLNMHYLLPTGLGGRRAAAKLGIPVVLTLIGMDVYDPHYRPAAPWRALMRRTIRKIDTITCISTFVRDVVQWEYPPRPDARVDVIPYGVDTARFRPGASADARRRFGIAPDERLVLTVQRLYARKHVAEFVDAAAVVRDSAPATRFLIVGDGPERAPLERRVADRGLGDRVVFAGEIKPDNPLLAETYAAADVFAFHTLHEGLGIVLLEALAAGCPIVTTIAGGTTDIVRDGENGLLVPPADARALAAAILRLLGDDALRRKLATAARQVAEAEFDWDRVADRYVDAFRHARRAARLPA